MSERIQYRKRPKFHVTAVQVDLDLDSFKYKKWGHDQTCESGDWVVNNDGDVYTVKKDVFVNTYQMVRPGLYEKIAEIWAEEAAQDGSISTLEGATKFKAGDYLVFDREEGGDGYAINKHKFEKMYERVYPENQLTPEQQNYLQVRLSSKIESFRQKAASSQRYFYIGQTIAIVAAALVPVFSGFIDSSDKLLNWVVAILGGTSAVVAGLLSLFKFQENWLRSKSTYEDLESHISQFELRTGIYGDQKNAFNLLVENCETILNAERGQWAEKSLQGEKDDE